MLKQLIAFCDFCIENDEAIYLQAYREGEKYFHCLHAKKYEYVEDDGYICFEVDDSEEFLVEVKGKELCARNEPNEQIEWNDFPREKHWGQKVLFEIIDKVHDKKIYFTVGTEDSKLVAKYKEKFNGLV